MSAMIVRWITVCGSLLLGGCAASPEERLCRADITTGLINPETAEFFEFQNIDRRAAEQQVLEWALKGRGITEAELYKHAAAEESLRSATKELLNELESTGGVAFKSYQVKAESRLGFNITSTYICAVSSNDCTCFDEQSIAG